MVASIDAPARESSEAPFSGLSEMHEPNGDGGGSMRILVVCGAGASSTFVALRVRKSAEARSLPVTAEACPLDSLPERLPSAGVILLGPHLGDRLADVRNTAARAGVAVVVLPDTIFSSPSGDEALDLALDAAGAMSSQGKPPRSDGGPTHG
jgi:PTS system cellobiose-specific IIB component